MSTTKTFAAALLFSTSVALAPAFADEVTSTGTQYAAVEVQLPVNPATEPVPAATVSKYDARTGAVKSAEEVRALLHGQTPAHTSPAARADDLDAKLIRDVAGMFPFQDYRPLAELEIEVAGSGEFETVASVGETVAN